MDAAVRAVSHSAMETGAPPYREEEDGVATLGSRKWCPRFAPFFSALTWVQRIEPPYHTWQAFSLTIGCPALQPNAF
jgi:hypothetical protein